ncbi:hypothetical protein ACGRH2_13250 [Vibrio barjaei]|uniref:Uncharacterized protein n=1 Tax=Vibrio barjaei TaxID=1676683 RepID=A0ABW7IJ01_9VIBR
MSLDRVKLSKSKIKNVKARRDIKRNRARKLQFWSGKSNFASLVRSIPSLKLEKDQYVDLHTKLVSRTEQKIDVLPKEVVGIRRIRCYSEALNQVYLHRALNLYEGAFHSLSCINVYQMILSIRAIYETTAAIGFLHGRIDSFNEGNIGINALDKAIMELLLGSRDSKILELDSNPQLLAKNVMTMLEHADKILSGKIMGGSKTKHKILKDCYEWLCEFCHPNFHSASIAYSLDKDSDSFLFNYDLSQLPEKDEKLIEYLLIPTFAFIDIFDRNRVLLDRLMDEQFA